MSPPPAGLLHSLADRYRIERELGAGGMATVYLAHDLRHDRDVAIKVLHSDLGAALGAERFLSEIRTTARLQHPHILPLLDSGDADGLLYYVMPVVTGESLRARLERERQLPIADAVRLACEIASALDYAHRHGVIHRDVKPENVLLHDGQAQVADFGIALAVQSAGTQRLTQTGLSLGTPQYMSPEQAMGEKVIDARADIYALGAVTYEMLTGEPPFTGPTVQAVVARLISEEPRPLAVQRRSIPEHVADAVTRALEKLPADRFASAAEFAAALDAHTSSTRTVVSRAGSRRSRRTIAALGALAIVSSIAAGWGWMRPAPVPPVVRYRIVIDSVPAVKNWSGDLAISPDGATIVRAGGPGGALLVRRREELSFSHLAGTKDASGPFFSPDGARVGYYANGALMAVPLDGGPPTVIADSIAIPESMTWGSDGYLYRSMLTNGMQVLGRTEARTGAAVRPFTTVDTAAGELTHMYPDLLPDADAVLFQVAFRDGRRRIAIADLASGKHTVLMEGVRPRYARSGHLLYTTADGKLWAVAFDPKRRAVSGTAVEVGDRIPATVTGPIDFAISAAGTLVYSTEDAGSRRELTWVARDGSRTLFDSSWKGELASPALSPDGARVAVALTDDARTDIWIKPVAGGLATRLTGEQHRTNAEPAWSPDGRWVSYIASPSGGNSGDVWRQRADGSGRAERVATSTRPMSEQSWTRDGALLARTTTATMGAGDIVMLRAASDSQPIPLVASPRAEYSPVASPDGAWLAYVSNETGRYEVYVTPLANPGSGKWAITTSGGSMPRWSHRGDEIFYMDLRSHLVAARVTTTPAFVVESRRVLFDASDFLQPSVSRRNYDVSADDQRFLMVQRADGTRSGQVVVVENWPEEMRRRARQR
jgi:eukaryotic-like serine/threonine-protein kinase